MPLSQPFCHVGCIIVPLCLYCALSTSHSWTPAISNHCLWRQTHYPVPSLHTQSLQIAPTVFLQIAPPSSYHSPHRLSAPSPYSHHISIPCQDTLSLALPYSHLCSFSHTLGRGSTFELSFTVTHTFHHFTMLLSRYY